MTRPSQFLAALLLPFSLLVSSPAPAREPAAAPVTVKADPALWVVKDKDTTIYLFGTVHVLKPGYEWFTGGVKKAFDASDELVLEVIEPEDQAAMGREMGAIGVAPADSPALSTRLTEEARRKYIAAMEQTGLPWQAFERFKPWMAGMVLSVAPLTNLGYDPKLGVEKVLSAAAKANGKTIGALETVSQQLGFFNGLDDGQQIAFLNATVDGLPEAESQFASLMANWAAGDPDALAKEMNESLEATPVLAKVLIEDRNANWAQWIDKRLETPGTVFVAVGAGHLAGAPSVQQKLKALGIHAKRVKTQR
ncbi:TraB/GumN family protein [Sphingobium aquiterrae]|uniref:TraB/GumN family protein n=1 Tax=Sphingobium aquiterrae TaxID=2038656 RepID=UPI003015C887